MWLFTTIGFYSAVQDRDEHEYVWVRSRSRLTPRP